MNSREPATLRTALGRRHNALRQRLVLRQGLRGASLATVAVTLAVLAGVAFGVGVASAWVRLVLLGGAIVAAAAWAVVRFRALAPGFETYLERAETSFPEIRSWLRNAVDFSAHDAAPGTSTELAQAVEREAAGRVARLPLERLEPPLDPRRPIYVFVGSLALLLVAMIALPARFQRSWSTLLDPEGAAPPVTLSVEPGSVRVSPGASLTVFARVTGTSHKPRLTRDHAPALDAVAEGRTGDTRLWRFDLTQLTHADLYRVRVATVRSPDYHIELAGEPEPVSFEIEYRAPGYARMPVQRGSALRGDLTALRGAHAHIEVTFDRDLTSLEATTAGGSSHPWVALTPRRFRGEIAIDRESEYELHAVASAGEGRFRYRIQPVSDAPPVISVRVPSGDVDLPNGQQVPLDVIGQDDLGLTELQLQYRKDAAEAWTTVPLARFAGEPREAEIQSRWDASALGMLPGQSAVFRFVLFDDNAVGGRGRAESPTFELKFPSLADLYDNIDHTQGEVQKSLEKVADQAKELQKSLDKLERQAPRAPSANAPQFERSEELKSNLARQQELAMKLDDAAQQLRQSLEQASERNAFNDELQRKLQEMAQLMQQIQSPEFRDALKKMEQALEKMDKTALENQLPDWKKNNQDMMKNLERTIELLKQLREEESLASLAKRAEELKAHQDELNAKHEANERSQQAADSKTAEQQEQAAKETEKLAQDVKQMADSLATQNDQQDMNKVASDLQQQAADAQHQAAKQSQQSQNSNAKQNGKQASQELSDASKQLQQMANRRSQEQSGVDLAAVRRAAQDLVSLQRSTEANLGSSAPSGDRADQQTDLSEGVARVADSLAALGKQTPFLSPKLDEALGRAMNRLSDSGKDLASGNRGHGEQLGREGSVALNQAVLELRLSEQSMCNNPTQGKSGSKPNMGQRMADLGEQQSQLNQRSRGLAQQLTQQMRLSTGNRDEMQRLAEEQQRIAEQLQQIQRDDETRHELLGRLDQTQREMKEVAEALRNGNTGDDLEDKQTRILSRLLDAQRSVNRRDFDPERESRPGEDMAQRSAPQIPADLLRETDHLRLDLLKADSDRYPAQYRAFIEAYLRTLNGQRR